MVIEGRIPPCDRLSVIRLDDEWWFYQCAGIPEDKSGESGEEVVRRILSNLQGVFDNAWYVKYGNTKNGGICANLLLGGVQNTAGNMLRLASNLARLGGIEKLGHKLKSDLRSISKCRDTILELEILSCFAEEGFPVIPYPILNNGKVSDGKVTVGVTDIFFEVTHNEWPKPADFPGLNWKSKEGSKIIGKCIREVQQLPKSECGAIIINPPTLFDKEMGTVILESMRDFLFPGLYTRISGIILTNKLIERSGFIKAQPVVLINTYAEKRCDNELERLAEALWKHPTNF